MRVTVVLFATYRDLAGASELELELPAEARAADAVARIRQRSRGAAQLPEAPVIAVNCSYAPLDRPLRDGDEIAILPPVAGG